MPTRAEIDEVALRVAERFQPRRIVLFGSHARGTARPDSDVDLLVVMPYPEDPGRMALRLCDVIKPRFAVDFVVRSPQELRRRLADGDPMLEEAMREGLVLHETSQ